MKAIVRMTFFCLAIFTQAQSIAEDNINSATKADSSAIETLSPGLRDLLKKEMLALQQGMTDIIPAYVSGNWGEIESIAQNMKSSYILQQSLTEQQVKELHASLPGSFIKLDQHFHYLAGMLMHAAKNKKSELVGFYYSKLLETCVSCHTQYAKHKFPKFIAKYEANEHSH